LIFFLLIPSCKKDDNPTQPSTGNIQGRITNAGDGTVIIGASVQTNPATSTVNTNSSGDFVINDVTPGTYTVTASKSGFTTNSVNVSVVSGKTAAANIQLSPGVTAPPIPTLSSPSNGATNIDIPPTLSWNSSSGATSYTLQVSTISSFSSTVFDNSSLMSTSQQVSGLNNNTTYYWRVSATNSYGTSSPSTAWSFTTATGGTAPSIPTLSSPSNGSTNVAIPPTLSWNASSGAPSYRLQVSTSSSFSSTVYDQSGPTSTSQQVSGLSNNTTYYWRVSATNSYGTSGWSSVWSLTTINFTCGSTITYSGKTYNTVQIGSQCWLKENLDVGIMIQGIQNPSNDGTIEKYCYDNDLNNCATYGGLYQWNEAMAYSTTHGTTGICPSGWHIPVEAEFQILLTAVNNDGNALKAIGQGSSFWGGAGTNTSGFSALLSGYLAEWRFGGKGHSTNFWSSSQISELASSNLWVYHTNSGPGLRGGYKDRGLSVRCLKD